MAPRFSDLKIERRGIILGNPDIPFRREQDFEYLWGRLKEMVASWKESDDVYTRYGQAHSLKRVMKDLKMVHLDGQEFWRPIRKSSYKRSSEEESNSE